MNKNIRNIYQGLAFTAVAAFMCASCSEWTDMESIKLNEPDIKSQNPELYTKYLENLVEFKKGDHQVVIVSINNERTMPTNRSHHLTDIPDSVDYICLNNPLDVNEVNIAEIAEVHKLGTKVLGLVDFDAIENEWKRILEEEANTSPTSDETIDGNEDEREKPDNATRFIEYCKNEVDKRISAIKTLEVDGIEINFTGFDLNSLVEETAIAAETARQAAFFDAVTGWKSANADKSILFKGSPQNVIDKSILSDCKYIIVNAHSAKNLYEMSYLILMVSAENVPTDRFVMGVTTPYLTNSGTYNGELGDGSSAIIGAAQWAVSHTPDYTKAGISIDAAEQDYFNPVRVYPNIKEAIDILSPTVK